MVKSKKIKVVTPEVVEEAKDVQNGDNIEFHLDRDLNDPRNATKSNKLPSLND